jgi:2,4-dienoyl-CoA reductase-like NADH-dependent reductase (Old Yellow Enzyme family)
MAITIPPAEPALAIDLPATLDLSALFRPITVGAYTLSNRFVMPGMQRGFCKDGMPLPELADYYRKRAEGGVALVIGESAAIDHPSATAQPSAARLNAATVDGWARCIEAVRGAGSEMLLQLWHEGGLRNDRDGETLSPSGMGHPRLQQGRAMTAGDLEAVRDAYVRSALLAKAAGASGIEVHCAHGYFLDLFLWPDTNRRGDGYGGDDIADRVRFPAEVTAAIRDACGSDFLISVRFSQWKEHDYGAKIAPTPHDLAVMVTAFREAGADLLHASTRRFWIPEWPGKDWSLAGWTRHLSGLPTITVGSVGLDKDVMESFTTEGAMTTTIPESLAELARRMEAGEFDLVSVGRSLISDADWVNKVRAGDFGTIRAFRKEDVGALEWEFAD